MTCREFRAQHCAFVDDTLSAMNMAGMCEHLERCASCSRHDTRVRRSLLLVRNAPRLECSPDFAQRLQARLRELGPIDRRHGVASGGIFPAALRFSAYAAGLAAVVAVAALATASFDRSAPEVRMAPVVASVPDHEMSPAYVASVMSGMPIWPAVLVAGQSSMHMANYEFQLAGYSR